MIGRRGDARLQFIDVQQPAVLPGLELPHTTTAEHYDVPRVPAIALARVGHTPVGRLPWHAAAVEHPAVGVYAYGALFRGLRGQLPELQLLSEEHDGAHDGRRAMTRCLREVCRVRIETI